MLAPCPILAEVGAWSVKAGMPTSRVLHGACVVEGNIYVFGGQQVGGGAGIASVEAYDPQADSWSARSDMPTARLGMAVSAVGGKCYLIGGATAPGSSGLSLVEEYDPAADTWRQRAGIPTARAASASGAIDGKIYVAGGLDRGDIQSTAVGTLEIYDPANDSWSIGADLPAARAFLAASSLDSQLYVIGGGAAALGTLDSALVHRYDPLTDTWSQLAFLDAPRGGLVANEINGRLLAIGGGFDVGRSPTLEEYDPGVDAWTQGPDMPTARWGATSSVIDGTLFVIGGSTEWGPGHSALSTNEAYAALEAPTFLINAGLNDAWYNPATPGQGFLISVFPAHRQMFVAWFTYDTERPPDHVEALLGEPGHRWLTAQGPYDGDTASLTLYLTQGGVFDAATPAATTDSAGDGTLTIEFADCNAALVTYDITSLGLSAEIPIERIVLNNVARCQAELDQDARPQ